MEQKVADSKHKKRKIKPVYLYIAIALMVLAVAIAGFQISYSFDPKAGETEEYINTSRTSGKKIINASNVKIDKLIPDEYSFSLKYTPGVTECKTNGGVNLSNAERQQWADVIKDGIVLRTAEDSRLREGIETKANDIINPRDDGDEQVSLICENIGTYKGKAVGLRVSVVDFEPADTASSTYVPFIGLYDPTYNKKIGVYAGNINRVELKYEFCESVSITDAGKTTCSNGSLGNVKGHIAYNDVDWLQGVHVLNSNKGLYSRSNSKLSITDVNGSPYIYATDEEHPDEEGLYNPKVSFTELFDAKSFTRVYTFASKTGAAVDASGGIWNTDVVSGASLEYAKNTPSGTLGKAVKKGDTIKYTVTYTNEDVSNPQNITIKSILSKGLEYVKGSASKLGDPEVATDKSGKTILTWTTKMEKNSVDSFTYAVKVDNADVGIVSNQVTIKSSDGSEYSSVGILKNSVPHKSYDENTTAGKNGEPVSRSDRIKYNVKYANSYDIKKNITITETLSKYVEYIKNSSNIGEPVVTKNSDGTTKLVWTRSLGAATEETLTYAVKVAGDAPDGTIVSSGTTVNIEDEGSIKLDTLTNKVDEGVVKKEEKQEEYIPKKSTPGYGSVAILIRDSYTGKPVKNTQFALYNYDNSTIASDINGSYLETITTGTNGVAEWNEVPFGKYILKEVSNSEVFKSGFYEYNSNNTTLINSLEFTFDATNDSLKWYKADNMIGGISSGENFIERDSAKLGDINSDDIIDNQDLALINAIYKGTITDVTGTELKKYMIAADVDNNGKCNDGNCKITENDIKLLESYIENPKGNQFEAFKVIYLKGSFQKRATVSVLGIPLDLKISNLEYDTSKELRGAKFVIKDESGNVYSNIEFTHDEEQVYLPVGSYIMTQEEARIGYDKYTEQIPFTMDANGDVRLLTENYEYIKLEESKDKNKDHLIIYNKLGNNEVRVPYMNDSDRVVPRAAKVVGGSTLVIGAAAAAAYRYGISYKILASRLMNFIK